MAQTRRKTRRSWMQEDRYFLHGTYGQYSITLNIAETFERMCKSKRWKSALLVGADEHHREMGHPPKHRVVMTGAKNGYERHCDRITKRLLDCTMDARGVRKHSRGRPVFSVGTSRGGGGSGGRAFGAHVCMRLYHRQCHGGSGLVEAIAFALETALHELAHYMHLSTVYVNKINGIERPHDRMFNAILCEMARYFWGYDRTPLTSGYSVGRGYATTDHLRNWIIKQLTEELDGSEWPRIMDWIEWQ